MSSTESVPHFPSYRIFLFLNYSYQPPPSPCLRPFITFSCWAISTLFFLPLLLPHSLPLQSPIPFLQSSLTSPLCLPLLASNPSSSICTHSLSSRFHPSCSLSSATLPLCFHSLLALPAPIFSLSSCSHPSCSRFYFTLPLSPHSLLSLHPPIFSLSPRSHPSFSPSLSPDVPSKSSEVR